MKKVFDNVSYEIVWRMVYFGLDYLKDNPAEIVLMPYRYLKDSCGTLDLILASIGIVTVCAGSAVSFYGYTIAWPLTWIGGGIGIATGIGLGAWHNHLLEGLTSGLAIGPIIGVAIAMTPYIFSPAVAGLLVFGAMGALLGDYIGHNYNYNILVSIATCATTSAAIGAGFASTYSDTILEMIGVGTESVGDFDFS